MTSYRLRLATASDAEAICRIYNQGIEDRVATLETELRTPDERRQWLANRSPRHPVIVAEFAEFVVAGSVRPALTEGGLKQVRPGSGSADNPFADNPSADSRSADNPLGVIAWASLNVFNARECYRFVADISVYVELKHNPFLDDMPSAMRGTFHCDGFDLSTSVFIKNIA